MLRLFGGGKSDHPMADLKGARQTLDDIPVADPFAALSETAGWIDSVVAFEEFKPEYRVQLLLLIDEAAQVHVRKLYRTYLTTQRMSQFQEGRLWNAIHGYWQQIAAAYCAQIDFAASGAKGSDSLKNHLLLLCVRALRALGQRMKWQYIRYGPFDNSIWATVAKVYALAEIRKFSKKTVQVTPHAPGDSSPEQEFLRAVMLSACSPDSLLPLEIEIAERLIAHFCASFNLLLEQQPEIAYWIDLAVGQPPLRLARPPHHAPTLRFFAAGKALDEMEDLIAKVKAANAVPEAVNLGGNYDPRVVLNVLGHLRVHWSNKPPERKYPRHSVKTRIAVAHGREGVLGVLGITTSLDFDPNSSESWIVDNVSAGGFGAVVSQVKGDWLHIGTLLGLQPEGGDNWLLGVVRRISRESPAQLSTGIQTLARAMTAVPLKAPGGAAEHGVLLDPAGLSGAAMAQIILPPGLLVAGEQVQFEFEGKTVLVMSQGVAERSDDYELVRFKPMFRES